MKLPENKMGQIFLDSNIGNVCFQKQKQKANKKQKKMKLFQIKKQGHNQEVERCVNNPSGKGSMSKIHLTLKKTERQAS